MTTGTLNEQQLQEAQRREQIARALKIIRRAVAYSLMTLLGFIFLFPIIFMLVAAFKPNDRVIADLASFRAFVPKPSTLTTANITDVFDRVRFGHLVFNSLFITLVTVITGLFVNSMAAYVLARLRWFGRSVMLGIIVSLIIIPLESIAIPLLMQVNEMRVFLTLITLLVLAVLTGLMLVILWRNIAKQLADNPAISLRVVISAVILVIVGGLNLLRANGGIHNMMQDILQSLGLSDSLTTVSVSTALQQDILLILGWLGLIAITWLIIVVMEVYPRTRPDAPSDLALKGSFWDSLTTVMKQTDLIAAAVDRFLLIILTLLLALPFEILLFLVADASLVIRGSLLGNAFSINIISSSWLNSYYVQILPFVAEPFSIFLFYQFFIGIPKDFDEAAYVDGAGPFRIYWQVMIPLSRPVIATVAILKFLQFWSFYLWPLMVTRGDEYQPLMVGMDFFQTQAPIKWGSIMAYAAMVTIPVLITFLLFQKWFVQSVSSSGVKG